MNKFYSTLKNNFNSASLLFLILFLNNQIVQGQCATNGNQQGATINPAAGANLITIDPVNNGDFHLFDVLQNYGYEFQSCASSFDTRLDIRLNNNAGPCISCGDYDNCNTNREVEAVVAGANQSWAVSIRNWNCAWTGTSAVLGYRRFIPIPMSGSVSFTSCTDNITDMFGQSFNYGNNWNGNAVINATAGNQTVLNGSIVTEANFDFVRIYDGNGTGSLLLWQGSGSQTIPQLVGSQLTVQLQSDGSIVAAGPNLTSSCCTPQGDPATFGVNRWRVYAWNAGNNDASNDAWNRNYAGFYEMDVGVLNFDTRIGQTYSNSWSWNDATSPSSALGWSGCPVRNDYHSFSAKRQEFPCGYFRINLPNHDDRVQVFVNGNNVFDFNGCCAARPNIWEGYLGTTSTVELRIAEGVGGSHGSIEFVDLAQPLTITSSNASICQGENRTLTANHGGGTWSVVSGPASIVGNTLTATAPTLPSENAVIRYTLQGCTVDQTINVTAISTDPSSITGTTSICTGSSTTLTTSGGTLGTGAADVWYKGTCNTAFDQTWATQPYVVSGTTVNSTTNGILNVTSTNGDPMIDMYGLGSFDPNVFKYINIRYRVISGTAGNVEIFFTNSTCLTACSPQMVSAPLISDNTWRVVSVDMSTHASWTSSAITGWRYDWATATGVNMEIDFISLDASPIVGTGTTLNTDILTSTTLFSTQKKGLCNNTSCASVNVTVNPTNTITNATNNNQTVCSGVAIADITYNTTGATGANVTGLPTGVTASWVSNVLTISGTPDVPSGGTFNYTVTMTGGCTAGQATPTGTITVTPTNTISSPTNNNQTVCSSVAIADITYNTTGATGATVTGLPTGVTSSWASNVLTISGTPDVPSGGTFNYTVTMTGGCTAGQAIGTGIIMVTAINTAGTASSTPTICLGEALTPITHTTTGATGVGTPTGLPAGVSATWAANIITISGTPTQTGTFSYSIPLTGGCGAINATGSITVSEPTFYKSTSTGNWTTTGNWEQSCDGNSWVPATNFPTAGQSASVVISSGTTIGMNANYVNATPGNNVIIEAGATLDQTTGQNFETASLNIQGTFIKGTNDAITGTITVANGGVFRNNFNGGTIPTANWQTGSKLEITGITNATSILGTNQDFYNVEYNSPSANSVLTFSSGGITTINNLDIVNSGTGAFSIAGTADIQLEGNLTISASSTFSCLDTPTLKIRGNWLNDGITNLGPNSVVSFNNQNQNQFISGNNVTNFPILEVNKGGTELELNQNINVSGQLIMTGGNLHLNDRSIDLGSTGVILGETNANRVYCICNNGSINRTQTITHPFIGNPGNLGLVFETNGTSLGNTTIIRRHRQAGNNASNPAAVHRFYDVFPGQNNGSLNLKLTFNYFDNELVVPPPSNNLTYFRSTDNGNTWIKVNGGINGSNFVEIQPWQSFSLITVGDDQISPLPVSLLKFQATCTESNGILINWSTASEINSDYFILMKSVDGWNWEELTRIKAAGFSNQTLFYTYNDQSVSNGIYYYKLVQVDNDGTKDELPITWTDCNQKSKEKAILYPNPTNNVYNLKIYAQQDYEKATIRMVDMTGRTIKLTNTPLQEGENHFVNYRDNLKPGIYNLIIMTGDKIWPIQRLVVID